MKENHHFLLVNINNTNTSFALATPKRIVRIAKVPTVGARLIDVPGRLRIFFLDSAKRFDRFQPPVNVGRW